ncbi:MAG: YIP1 family protein [Bryobacteraceae bacterium]
MTDIAAQQPEMNEISRLTGVFWEPKPVYENLAVKPRWWVPLILLTVLAICYSAAFSRIVGWDTFMRQQMETNPRLQQLSVEQRERIIQTQGKVTQWMALGGATVGVAVSTIVMAGVLLLTFNVLGGASLRFKQAFSITSYSMLPTALSTILAIIVMFFKNPEDFDLRNPLVLNVGAFLDPASVPKWLHSIGVSLDLFSFWVILLLALGFWVASKTMSYTKSLILVVIPWAAYVLIKSGWTALFS